MAFEKIITEKSFPIWQQSMRAGDATFHNGWLIHGATANQSDTIREAMIVTYYPDGTRVDELTNSSRVNDAEVYLGGRKPGEMANSKLNTLVFRR